MRSPSAPVAAVLTVVALALVGCAASDGEPNAVDAERLAALEAAPPFDAEPFGATWAGTPARTAPASTNVLAYRGSP